MKTRKELYSKEATELLRVISEYRTLLAEQVYRLFPGHGSAVKSVLNHLVSQGRIIYDADGDRYSVNEECDAKTDRSMLLAFWVLLDFIDKAEYHFAADFPVKISFFGDGEMYDIIHVPSGQEVLLNHAMSGLPDDSSRRIILIDRQAQIKDISIANTAGFCTVDENGGVCYYKLE